jgi:endonuclease/exonuclease/phosphatase family metal-dependent hydrolase
MNYTWRNDYSEWPAGKLDYILVQDGAVRVLRSFALETASMSAQRLNAYGLESGDALEASDHFIVVADLAKHDRPGTKPVKIKKGR